MLTRLFVKPMRFKIRYISLVMGVILALICPAYAVPTSLAGPAKAAASPTLLQFTSGGHALGFTPQGMYAATGSHALHVDFVNANYVQPQVDTADSPATPSLKVGASKAAPLGRVTYPELWEGVTLAYSASAGNIYTTLYSLTPGADAQHIRLRYNAPLTLNPNGTLGIAFETGALTESAPIAWQNINGKRVPVEVRFSLPLTGAGGEGQTVAFALGQYDPSHALTIDPSLTWNAFLGGSLEDWGRAIAVDGSGNVYVAGNSYASWGNSVRAYDFVGSSRDGFAAKLDPSGKLLWNTFLGGSGTDAANGIAVDSSGNVYIAGDSDADWGCEPVFLACTVAPYFSGVDAFAAKLDSSGFLQWNTFMIGVSGRTEYGTAIAVDTLSNPNVVYVAGDTDKDFYFDAFVAKLDLSGSAIWFDFLGADLTNDFANAIAVDGSGNVYVAGDSDAAWGNPVRDHHSGVGVDVFVAKLDSSANLIWNTFLGGNGTDHGYGIAVDGSGNVYVAGDSTSPWTCLDFFGGCTKQRFSQIASTEAFIATLNSSGHLDWNAFLSLNGNDSSGRGVAVGGGNVYVTGNATEWGTDWSAFIYRLSTASSVAGRVLSWTLLGGSGNDYGNGIAFREGKAYVAGYSDTPWGSPVRPFTYPKNEAFVAKVDFLYRTYLPQVIR